MKTSKRKPVVLIPADVKQLGEHPFHVVGQKYILAVVEAASAIPLLVPAISSHLDMTALLEMADGVLITGSVSNLHPSHFGQTVHDTSLPLDPARDALTMNLIKATIDAGKPLLAICRGFQELNVVYGGSLHQAVHELTGLNDHRSAESVAAEEQYGISHAVKLRNNGKLADIVGGTEMMVNSIHGQGLDRLGLGLTVEAHAPDGLVEAISVDAAKAFALGVQWHPEWKVMENPQYKAIFNAFGEACKAAMLRRIPPD
jgi:putative glutamine amidotransferase